MRNLTFIVFGLYFLVPHVCNSQDEIILADGGIIKAKVSEVGVSEIKYKKWDNLEGPTYSTAKAEVFMIKYENGSKDVFSSAKQTQAQNESSERPIASTGEPATIYFIRPKKMASSSPEIIVGTVVPDEVVTKVRNGRWYKARYNNFGPIEFVAGVYAINPVHFTFTIQPGKTYYVFCTILTKGFKVMAELQMLDKTTADREMGGLKEQLKAK